MRFTVKEHGIHGVPGDRHYSIQDNDAAKYSMPEKAVTIYFVTSSKAQEVCNKLNNEWARFERYPK